MNIICDKENVRIDKYLSELDSVDLTRAKIQKLIKTGNIKVNGNEVKESYKTSLEDNIEINIVKEVLSARNRLIWFGADFYCLGVVGRC